jgi:RNA polymerase sigma-70 factor (ECF subfamily)
MAIGQWNESVTDLIPGYRNTKRTLEKVRDQATDKAWKETLGLMIGNCEYSLQYLETGGNPNRRRGVEARYERPWDPAWITKYESPNGWVVERESRDLTDDERFRIEEAMRDLTDREKQCFMMSAVDGMTEYDIARELHLGRSTVQKFLERAKNKIENAKINSLFLLE